jgi:acyl dehydratase
MVVAGDPRPTETQSGKSADDGLIRGTITDAAVEMMRARIGYPNPTLRNGLVTWPWNEVATSDAIRHYAQGYGDGNPLFCDPAYGATTRWGDVVAPPGFEWTMGTDISPQPPAELHEATRKALRGVHLFNAGHEGWFLRPIVREDKLRRSTVVADVAEKVSSFRGRSVIVTNEARWIDQRDETVAVRRPWYVHVERRPAEKSGTPREEEQPATYTDEELDAIDAAYDAEFVRGSDTLFYEDVEVGAELPMMVKGPFTITDMINFFMGAGWYGYGFPALRLGRENRRQMPGFYSRDQHNAWDTLMRIHWDVEAAQKIGVRSTYDIGPIRWTWLAHYCTNFAGDDGWVLRVRGEFRRFNHVGDTTWITGRVTSKRIDPAAGPVVELELTGTNQRGAVNITGEATIMLPSKAHGPVVVPVDPSVLPAAGRRD